MTTLTAERIAAASVAEYYVTHTCRGWQIFDNRDAPISNDVYDDPHRAAASLEADAIVYIH